MEFHENQAIYLQIAEWICERVVDGVWTSGQKLPSVRELAVELEVNPNTVSRAYEFVQNEGFVCTKRGIGQFVADDAVAICTSYLRRRFSEHEIPLLFRHVDLLKLSREEWIKLYDNYVITNRDEEKQ